MKYLVTGSAGHLGEGLMRCLCQDEQQAVGLDILPSPFTDIVGSIADIECVEAAMRNVDVVFHAATLHKPHVATHARSEFVDTNIHGTLNLLEQSVKTGVKAFIFTSTTSTFGRALSPAIDQDSAWVTEELGTIPKNIYGTTKVAAEDLCELFHQLYKLPCLILKTSRFFYEEDDNKKTRETYDDLNAKVNEFLYRRADIQDIVDAHMLAVDKADSIGFDRFIISATSPFQKTDLPQLRTNAPEVVAKYFPDYSDIFKGRGWKMFPQIDRVYVNAKAREKLGWAPKFDFTELLRRVKTGEALRSELAEAVGAKPYHSTSFEDGPYPVD